MKRQIPGLHLNQRGVEINLEGGVVRTSCIALNGRSYQNLDAFAPEADWEALECISLAHSDGPGGSDGL